MHRTLLAFPYSHWPVLYIPKILPKEVEEYMYAQYCIRTILYNIFKARDYDLILGINEQFWKFKPLLPFPSIAAKKLILKCFVLVSLTQLCCWSILYFLSISTRGHLNHSKIQSCPVLVKKNDHNLNQASIIHIDIFSCHSLFSKNEYLAFPNLADSLVICRGLICTTRTS